MKLSELFAQLSYGELRQTHIGNDGCGDLDPKYYKEIISHINLGLSDLHKKFPLRTQEVFIQQYSHISIYHLDRRYAETNTESTEPYKYIKDSVDEPFLDDAIRIERVYDENGDEFYINDGTNGWSVFLPNHLSIQHPQPDDANTMSVIYRANHVKIAPNVDPDEQEITLPQVFIQPLLYYVAGRVFAGMNSGDSWGTSANYMSMYENACNDLKFYGVYNVENDSSTRIKDNGWV